MAIDLNAELMVLRPNSGGSALTEAWAHDVVVKVLQLLDMFNIHVSDTEPPDTTALWYDPDTASGPGVMKAHNGSDWVVCTPSLFASRLIDLGGAIPVHTHDSVYAKLVHSHEGVYAPLVHAHDSVYAQLSHSHDTSYVADVRLGSESTGNSAGHLVSRFVQGVGGSDPDVWYYKPVQKRINGSWYTVSG